MTLIGLADNAGFRYASALPNAIGYVGFSFRNMDIQRTKAVRQYVVFHLKLMEVLHLMLLSFHLRENGQNVENVMGHEVERFRETLLGATVTAYMALSDDPKQSTNSRSIWKHLYPKHAKAIDRIWEKHIKPGEDVMKAYRDKAGAHGDHPEKYFDAKFNLLREHRKVLDAWHAFYSLYLCLLKKQAKEQPTLNLEVESVLLDIELAWPCASSFNRRWLREMHLTETGPYTKTF